VCSQWLIRDEWCGRGECVLLRTLTALTQGPIASEVMLGFEDGGSSVCSGDGVEVSQDALGFDAVWGVETPSNPTRGMSGAELLPVCRMRNCSQYVNES
jgi:hypothetical protein